MSDPLAIREARNAHDVAEAHVLFEAYAAALGIDLAFQGFAEELATLPGAYAQPRGRIFLAGVPGRAKGCVALRPLAADIGEIKRLYVSPQARGSGLGRRLAQTAIDAARAIGYREVKLDTLATMNEAYALYASLGFRECAPYYDNPLPGVRYMALALTAQR
jgi:ribosomal protein S18 acetylase RimI-like enzyme